MAAAIERAYQRAIDQGYPVKQGVWVDGDRVNGVEFRIKGGILFWVRDRGASGPPEVYFFKPGVDRFVERC